MGLVSTEKRVNEVNTEIGACGTYGLLIHKQKFESFTSGGASLLSYKCHFLTAQSHIPDLPSRGFKEALSNTKASVLWDKDLTAT
jgi:hypothetical protein